jgi:trimethylamine:corrinoid methyltransferase-like protein
MQLEMKLQVLSDLDIQRVHEATLDILGKTGIMQYAQ